MISLLLAVTAIYWRNDDLGDNGCMEQKRDVNNGLKRPSYMRNNRRFFPLMLVLLVALVVVDGVTTRFLVMHQLGIEANPFLKEWVQSDILLVIKLVGATLAVFILWFLYKTKPRMAWITTSIFIVIYALLILWNIIVFYIATGRIT